MALTKTQICNLALSELGENRNQISDFAADTNSIAVQCQLHYPRAIEELVRLHAWNCCIDRVKLATISKNDYPRSVRVVGAGDSTWNTTLTYVDQNNSAPRYSESGALSSTKILSFSGTEWQLIDESSNVDYDNVSTATTAPPQDGWAVDQGDSPAPSIYFVNIYGWDYYSVLPTNCIRVLALTDIDTTWKSYDDRIRWAVEGRNILVNYTDPYLTYLKEPALADMDALFVRALYTLIASKLAIPIMGRDTGIKIRSELTNELLGIILPDARSADGFEDDDINPIESDWLDATMHNHWVHEYPFNQSL